MSFGTPRCRPHAQVCGRNVAIGSPRNLRRVTPPQYAARRQKHSWSTPLPHYHAIIEAAYEFLFSAPEVQGSISEELLREKMGESFSLPYQTATSDDRTVQ